VYDCQLNAALKKVKHSTRAEREPQILRKVAHPNVVELFNAAKSPDGAWGLFLTARATSLRASSPLFACPALP
jgi:hypothetical protein